MQQELPLKGIRVIDYTHFLAGPYTSRCLAALGAEVIKIERPTTGDAARQHAYFINGQSGYYLQQNIGKKGICLNLKDPRAKDMMRKLIDSADVLVENYRPGTLKKLGFGYEDVSKTNRGIVYCSISAYGHTGPDSHVLV
jgi:crotonobetainyl-CoA:carnitine CoA-transferase CaiB-like acyl-CoA transferase